MVTVQSRPLNPSFSKCHFFHVSKARKIRTSNYTISPSGSLPPVDATSLTNNRVRPEAHRSQTRHPETGQARSFLVHKRQGGGGIVRARAGEGQGRDGQ